MSYLGGKNQAMLFNIGYARNENLCISIPAAILEYNISENYWRVAKYLNNNSYPFY